RGRRCSGRARVRHSHRARHERDDCKRTHACLPDHDRRLHEKRSEPSDAVSEQSIQPTGRKTRLCTRSETARILAQATCVRYCAQSMRTAIHAEKAGTSRSFPSTNGSPLGIAGEVPVASGEMTKCGMNVWTTISRPVSGCRAHSV